MPATEARQDDLFAPNTRTSLAELFDLQAMLEKPPPAINTITNDVLERPVR